MTNHQLGCLHKNIAQGTSSKRMYKEMQKIFTDIGMKQTLEIKLPSGNVKYRFEAWDKINERR